MRPFLQDVVKFGSLGKTLVTMTTREPMFVPQILIQAGPGPILDWLRHFIALGAYDVAAGMSESPVAAPLCKALMGTAPSRELIEKARNGEAAGGGGGFRLGFRRVGQAAKVHAAAEGRGVEVGQRERLRRPARVKVQRDDQSKNNRIVRRSPADAPPALDLATKWVSASCFISPCAS